jgi:hypothetical protein
VPAARLVAVVAVQTPDLTTALVASARRSQPRPVGQADGVIFRLVVAVVVNR